MTEIITWDIDSAIIAPWVSDGVWGDNVAVKGVVSIQMEVEMKSGEQPGDGILYAVAAKAYAGTATFQFVNQEDYRIVEILTGGTVESSGGDVTFLMQRKPAPYFSIAGRAYLNNNVASDEQIWIPKCIITGNFNYGFADNEWKVPEFTARAVFEYGLTRASIPSLYVTRVNETARTLQIPLLGVGLS